MSDLSSMSDAELKALYESALQSQNAQTGQPLPQVQQQTYGQLAAAGGIDPKATPGSARLPKAMVPGGLPQSGEYYVDQQGLVKKAPQINDRVRAVARGVPILGAFADEANSATAATIAPLTDQIYRALGMQDNPDYIKPADTWPERYQQMMDAQALQDSAYDTTKPLESLGLQLGGGLASGLGALKAYAPISSALGAEAGMIPRIAAGMTEGGVIGGAHGYGMGQGALTDPSRLQSGGQGMALGAGFGGGFPVAGAAGRAAWDATGKKALNSMLPKVTVGAENIAPTAGRLPRLRTEGLKSLGTADLTDAIMATVKSPQAKVTALEERAAYDALAKALSRQGMSAEQAVSQARGLGTFGTLADTGEAAQDLARAATNTPGRAGQIANEALDLRQRGILQNGEFAIRPQSLRVTDRLQKGLGVKGKYLDAFDGLTAEQRAASKPAYELAYASAPVPSSALKGFAGDDLSAVYARARKISAREAAGNPDAPAPLPDKMPEELDWRTLDLMKQGMDDLISARPAEGVGANEQGALKGMRSRFVALLDDLNPNYAPARAAFAGPAAVKDAMEAGRVFMREDADLSARAMANLGDSEKQGFRLGAFQALKERLGARRPTWDAVSDLLTPAQLARLKVIFPSKEDYASFTSGLQNEQVMTSTRAAIKGNSSTAKQLAAMQDSAQPLEGLGTVAQAVTGSPGAISNLANMLFRGGPKTMDEPTADALAAVMFNMDRRADPTTIKKLGEAEQRLARALAARNSQGVAGGVAGANAGQAMNKRGQ